MDANDQVLALLKSRMSDLEQQIVGNQSLPWKSNSVCDNLVTADCNISAVLSAHDKIGAVARRLEELDRFLDPMFEESCGPRDVEAKAEIILSSLPQIQLNAQMLEQLKEQMPVLDSQEIKDVVHLSSRLEKLTLNVLHKKENLDTVSATVASLLQQYNDIIASIEEMFGRWDNILASVEYSRMPKKIIE